MPIITIKTDYNRFVRVNKLKKTNTATGRHFVTSRHLGQGGGRRSLGTSI